MYFEFSGDPRLEESWKYSYITEGRLPGAYDLAIGDFCGNGNLDVVASGWRIGNQFALFENGGDNWYKHILDENIQTLMKQVAIDYPRYDIPMKNESLVIVKSIMETGQTPAIASQELPMEETFIDEIDESLSKYTSNDIFFERGRPSARALAAFGLDKETVDNDIASIKKKTKRMRQSEKNQKGLQKRKDALDSGDRALKWDKGAKAPVPYGPGYSKEEQGLAYGKNESVGEADQAILKLAGVYK